MTVSEDPPATIAERIAVHFQVDDEPQDVPQLVTAALGLIAAVLVAVSALSAIESGHTGIGVSFVSAVVLFAGTVSVFEAGRRLGADD